MTVLKKTEVTTDQQSFRVCVSNTCGVPPPVPAAEQPARSSRGNRTTLSPGPGQRWGEALCGPRGPIPKDASLPTPPHPNPPYTVENCLGYLPNLDSPAPLLAKCGLGVVVEVKWESLV
ncbi:hypothetical protein MDA_GLEAN10013422 [Myotis davidii]|uniref:Uncharacterized protein n=1 Tax=Myotis davidii TaxID=225400 RepID=L5M0U2_MYODS|nr:hypothetical protein MDA_GLEAN10013422 [Myotis davidii]